MNNRSLSPSQKPLFPILHLWIVYLSHCPYSLSFFPHISTIVFFWTFPFFHLPICFLLRVSCHSYHRVMCWVTHLASSGREVPCPASTTIPNIFFNGADWIEIFRWPSFVPPEKTKLMQDQNNEGRSVFHLWAERGFHMVLLTAPLSTKLHHSIYQLSINQQ